MGFFDYFQGLHKNLLVSVQSHWRSDGFLTRAVSGWTGKKPVRSERLHLLRQDRRDNLNKEARQFPLSPDQQRIWFLAQLTPGNTAYHISAAVRLSGEVDYARLGRSFRAAINRHEALRTTFAVVLGEPVQVVLPELDLSLVSIDAQDVADVSCEEWASDLISQQTQAPFCLYEQPLIRGCLVYLGAKECVLQLVAHALIVDRYALHRLIAEMAALYSQEEGAECAISLYHYADLIQWQAEWRESDEGETAVQYWKNQLAGINSLLELPTDHSRPPRPTFCDGRAFLSVPGSIADKLISVYQREGYAPDLVLLAAWMILLFRYTGNADIVVGTLSPDPYHAHEKGVIGLCQNQIVIRLQITADQTGEQVMKNLADVVAEAKTHQQLPFSDLVEHTNPARELSHAPLFQNLFLWEEAVIAPDFRGLESEWLVTFNHTTHCDVTLTLAREINGEIGGAILYNQDLFERETITQLGEQYLWLVAALLADMQHPIGQLALLTDAQRRLILETWNETQLPYPQDRCIHHYFEQQALKTPEKPALYANGRFLSYRELNQHANQLAHYLCAQGVHPGAVVGVCLERCADLLISLLAILKAGAAYVPLDPTYPPERMTFILENARVSLLITQPTQEVQLSPGQSAPFLYLDEVRDVVATMPARNPMVPLTGSELAYVIYTSGSTGHPKGVEITHRNAGALIAWAGTIYTDRELTAVLAATSICFDLSIFEMFVPLAYGGMVVLVQHVLELVYQPPPVNITLINSVPSAVTELVLAKAIPMSVQTVNLAGEPFRYQLVHQLYAAGAKRVFNLYGPSEDTTYSTFALLDPQGRETDRPPIGRPIANTQIYLLDDQLQPVPPGVTGEIFIGGEGLARGYRHRPDLTQEQFIPSPFCPQQRLYRTGDLGKYRRDGQLEFIGRQDHQIKLRGYRIELGEIETILEQHTAVQEAVVVVRYLTPDVPVLVAYLVARQPQDNLTSALRLFLEQKLPNYMIPAYFKLLPSLPRTPNGKVDRKAMPEFWSPAAITDTQVDAPPDPLEAKLMKIWQEVLNIPSVRATDDFFDLGGNSLLAVRLMARIEQEFGYKLPLATLF